MLHDTFKAEGHLISLFDITPPPSTTTLLLQETALITAQELEDYAKSIPICAHTMRSFETPEEVFQRVATDVPLPKLPKVERYKKKAVATPTTCEEGCATLFLNEAVKTEAINEWHYYLCKSRMTKPQQAAFDGFATTEWATGGVDYSDSFHLVLRAVSTLLCSVRNGKTVEEAWEPFDVLAWGGWIALATEWTERKTRTTPSSLLTRLYICLRQIFGEGSLTKIALTKDKLSQLCGCILLNAQERSPESEFSRYIQYLNEREVVHNLQEYDWREEIPTDMSNNLYYSTKAQGVYRVHSVTNHSCDPNTEVQYTDKNDQSINMVALRSLAEGEEVTISYIDHPATRDLEFRQKYLLSNYRFICTCEKCEEEREKKKRQWQMSK